MLMLDAKGEWDKIDDAISRLSSLRRDIQRDVSGPAFQSLAEVARHYIRLRRRRENDISDLFHDPAWDILLDLYAAMIEGKEISVSSACIASAVPPTTALRHIEKLNRAGLLCRFPARNDKRRILVAITSRGEDVVRNFLHGLTGKSNTMMVV